MINLRDLGELVNLFNVTFTDGKLQAEVLIMKTPAVRVMVFEEGNPNKRYLVEVPKTDGEICFFQGTLLDYKSL